MINLSITDAAEASAAIADLAEELRVKAMRSGLREAGNVVRDRMRQLAPTDSGDLARSINVTNVTDRQRERLGGTLAEDTIPADGVAMIVGPNSSTKRLRKWRSMAHLIEFGVDAHRIEPKRSHYLAFGRWVVRGPIQHPGVAAQPFMAPASDTPGLDTAFYRGLERHINKLRRKGIA